MFRIGRISRMLTCRLHPVQACFAKSADSKTIEYLLLLLVVETVEFRVSCFLYYV